MSINSKTLRVHEKREGKIPNSIYKLNGQNALTCMSMHSYLNVMESGQKFKQTF